MTGVNMLIGGVTAPFPNVFLMACRTPNKTFGSSHFLFEELALSLLRKEGEVRAVLLLVVLFDVLSVHVANIAIEFGGGLSQMRKATGMPHDSQSALKSV